MKTIIHFLKTLFFITCLSVGFLFIAILGLPLFLWFAVSDDAHYE